MSTKKISKNVERVKNAYYDHLKGSAHPGMGNACIVKIKTTVTKEVDFIKEVLN